MPQHGRLRATSCRLLTLYPAGYRIEPMSMSAIKHSLIRGAWLLGALSATLNVSCGSTNPEALRDTTGATFSWTCSDTGCKLAPLDAPPPAQCDGSEVFYSYFWGNFVEICSANALSDSGAWGTDASLCRFVACDSDDECPQLPGDEYACTAGLCRNVELKSKQLGLDEVIALCMAEVPRPLDCRAQHNDPEVASLFERVQKGCESIVGPCAIPADCRKP